MNIQARTALCRMAFAVIMVSCFGSVYAGITVDATTNYADSVTTWTASKTIDFSAFDPSGSDKLVAVIVGRGGAFLEAPTTTFNGQAMTHVVTRPTPTVNTHRGVSSIFYLDSPPSGGNLIITYTNAAPQIQEVGIALLALSGTATNFSGPTISTNAATSGTLTTTKNGTLVVAGAWAGDGATTTLTAEGPLTSVLSVAIDTSSPYSAVAAGYYEDPDAGDIALSFNASGTTAGPWMNLVAAGFLPKPPPAGTVITIK